VIETADWIIDLGPESCEIVFAGAPEEIVCVKRSYTGVSGQCWSGGLSDRGKEGPARGSEAIGSFEIIFKPRARQRKT
jgi:hypothetical protein